MKAKLEHAWYNNSRLLALLRPLSVLFNYVSASRKKRLQLKQQDFALPIIVVGNITVGGTGKTPIVIALVKLLRDRGFNPAVISRGYGSQASTFPYPVTADSDPLYSGDEPLLIAKRCHCPVVIDPIRINAAVYAIQNYDCDVIISDDGLQHYALPRYYEIAVVDGLRGLANEKLLPEGPLREPPERLETVDAVLINGASDIASLEPYPHFVLKPEVWVNIATGEKCTLDEWQSDENDMAIAAIGNPDRFKKTLSELGLTPELICLPDHHSLSPADMPTAAKRILMTEKDAVKCQNFNDDRLWFLAVNAELPDSFIENLTQKIIAFNE